MTQIRKSHFVGFEQLKRSVSIEQVLRHYGLLDQLRPSGDSLTGVCPLHGGHNPSQFRVSLTKNCWICFGDCHVGGSIIDFVSRKERVGIREAALLLQDWFHLQSVDAPEAATAARRWTTVPGARASVNPTAREDNPPLRFTLKGLDGCHPYLKQRGLAPDTISTFGMGLCNRGSLRGWIAIPIHDREGRLIAYAGRWPGVPPEGMAKYWMPRGFRKSIELFNQHRAKEEPPREPLVVVEGFFGCMWVWQAGHRRVVSVMGSQLSVHQAARLKELAGEGRVILLFDGDEAGRKGRLEALARLSPLLEATALRLDSGQQPDGLEPQALLRLIRAKEEMGVAA